MKVLIVTGGNIDRDFAFSFLKENQYDEVIAVDGGLAFADEAGLAISHLVGDFDTIGMAVLERYRYRPDITVHQFIPEKDYTDTDIAVKLAIKLCGESSEKCVHILGGTGTRLDHVLANLQMLKKLMTEDIDGVVVDKNNQIRMICGSCRLKKEGLFGKYVSLIPATAKLRGITLEGFKYPLDKAETGFGESLCVSNELVSEEGFITIEEGMAWLILSKD